MNEQQPTPASSPPSQCSECIRLQAELDRALARILELEALAADFNDLRQSLKVALETILDLQAQINLLKSRNSTNSSLPPSSDPDYLPKPEPKASSHRKRGAQPGHPGHFRDRLPADEVIPHVPTTCTHCQTSLPSDPSPSDPPPTWHQVLDLPQIAAKVTEHQAHSRTCPCCGHVNKAEIPPEVSGTIVGPRLAATMAFLTGCCHLSRRQVQEILKDLFGVDLALGTIVNTEQQTCEALDGAHEEAQEAAATASSKNVDETSWKLKGKLCWLWTVATATVMLFVIRAKRNAASLAFLIGSNPSGVVGSDRWTAYNRLPLEQRQICWAHLKRDFQKLVDKGGQSKNIGQTGLEVVECLFSDWREFKAGLIDRLELKKRVERIKAELRKALEQGRDCADKATQAFCANILKIYDALWLFVEIEGVEPTNNHAERALRGGVLWRKISFGSQSESGCKFAERMMTVVGTLRLQKRSVLKYLEEAIKAKRSGQAAPKLLV